MTTADRRLPVRRVAAAVAQTVRWRRLRAKASRPPAAKISPGRPAPTTGPGTGVTWLNTATQPNGQAVLVPLGLVPASGTKTSPLNGSTVIEWALEVVGRLMVWRTLPSASTTSKNRVPGAELWFYRSSELDTRRRYRARLAAGR